jgi:hypothetical protein
VKVQFQYDSTYPGPPTNESEYAWLDLLPGQYFFFPFVLLCDGANTLLDGLGAVQHDELSDEIVTISMFHQLHCLVCINFVNLLSLL